MLLAVPDRESCASQRRGWIEVGDGGDADADIVIPWQWRQSKSSFVTGLSMKEGSDLWSMRSE